MLRCLAMLPCDIAIVDKASNKASLVNVLEEIGSPLFPAGIPHLTVYALLSRTADDPLAYELRLDFRIDGRSFAGFPIQAAFDAQKPRLRLMMNFNGFVAPSSGLMEIRLIRGEEPIGSCEIVCRIPETAQT